MVIFAALLAQVCLCNLSAENNAWYHAIIALDYFVQGYTMKGALNGIELHSPVGEKNEKGGGDNVTSPRWAFVSIK